MAQRINLTKASIKKGLKLQIKCIISAFVVLQIVFSTQLSYAHLTKVIGIPQYYKEVGMFFVELVSHDNVQRIFLGAAFEVKEDECIFSALENENPIEIIGYFTNYDNTLALDLSKDYVCTPISIRKGIR